MAVFGPSAVDSCLGGVKIGADMRSRALLIDAMGTLVTLDDPPGRLAGELRARFGVRVTVAQARTALGTEIAFYRRHLDEGVDAARLASLRARSADVLFAALPDEPALAAAAGPARVATLRAALRFVAFPDARPALQRARAAGARVVVVSNWDASLEEVLPEVGLAELVDGVVTSAQAGVAKPDPAIFARALALAGVPAAAARHVGDSPEADVGGARAAGIEAVLLDRAGGGAGAVAAGVEVIASLAQLGWP